MYPFTTADGVELRLTRFHAGDRGPVILSPGYGTSSLAFTIDTVDVNFPEFLGERGYDVWVLDYRASPALEASKTLYTLDEIAAYDYPAAVSTVRTQTGASSVQVVAHCVGSMTFLMAGLRGLEGVRSAVCSCLALHPVNVPLNRLRAWLRMPTLLRKLGIERISSAFHPDQPDDRLLGRLMRFYPAIERCGNEECQRIKFMYGDVFAHDKLNDETHESIGEMFGRMSMYTFEHITAMMRKGHVIDARGGDTYLPEIERLRLPITFIHGQRNHLFPPEGTQRTYELLRSANPPELYHRHVFPDYAHMDCFIGKDAAEDVYPTVVAELDALN